MKRVYILTSNWHRRSAMNKTLAVIVAPQVVMFAAIIVWTVLWAMNNWL